jgi:hypothetical protein
LRFGLPRQDPKLAGALRIGGRALAEEKRQPKLGGAFL